jgi:hypothetical protein
MKFDDGMGLEVCRVMTLTKETIVGEKFPLPKWKSGASLMAAALTVWMGLVAFSEGTARADDIGVTRRVGLGVVAGGSPGFSAKAWVTRQNAVDFGIGMGLGDFACDRRFNPCGQRMSFNIDYLVHPGRGYGPPGWLAWHIGFGTRVWFYEYGTTADDMWLALRVPIGLDLMVFDFLELFGEVAPSLGFSPTIGFLEGAVGARIYLF